LRAKVRRYPKLVTTKLYGDYVIFFSSIYLFVVCFNNNNNEERNKKKKKHTHLIVRVRAAFDSGAM
jgi:hypothetical protein